MLAPSRNECFVDGRTFKVLVVEDNPIEAKIVCRILQQTCLESRRTKEDNLMRPVEVQMAETAETALELLGIDVKNPTHSDAPFDLVLTDLYLPHMSGLDLILKIRTDPYSYLTPVVFLTCAEDDATVSKCFDAGANAFVNKSKDQEAFRNSINRIVEFWAHENRVPQAS